MTYYVFTNGTHTTAIDGDLLDVRDSDIASVMEAAAAVAAAEKFSEAGLYPVVKLLKTLDEEELPEDEAEDLGISPAIFLEIARSILDSEDHSLDSDAEISGFNAQTWSYIKPAAVMETLASEAPYLEARAYEARGDRVKHELNEVTRRSQAVVTASLDRPEIFSSKPEHAEAVASFVAMMKNLAAVVVDEVKAPEAVFSGVFHSWELGPDQRQEAKGLTAEQRKPWAVKVESSANRLEVIMWPALEDAMETNKGMNIVIEVNKGIPSLHAGLGPLGDTALHLHAISGHGLEVTSDLPGELLVPIASKVYPGQALIYTNGSPGESDE